MQPLTIWLAASEVVGFAKTGGLADVAGSLPRALARRGHHCRIVLPLYRSVRRGKIPIEPTSHELTVPLAERTLTGKLWRAVSSEPGVTVYLIEQAGFYERDDPAKGTGLYHYTDSAGQKHDYADNCARYVFFCRAVLEAMRALGDWPDILHANDWQTGLLPVYLHRSVRKRITPALPDEAARTRSVFTIHNLAYQGAFWHWDLPLTGLPWDLFNPEQLEFYGQLSLLKAGIVFADAATTVSPTYAREIQTPYMGVGMQGILSERRDRLFGIVNGVDYGVWNPATDPHLPANYDITTVGKNKPVCKAALQRHFGLPEEANVPLLGVVARLVEQKGIELVVKAAERLLSLGTQLVVLGEGDPLYHGALAALARKHPSGVGIHLGFDEGVAHRIEAGADLYLMPSLYEPSGLNQLYSLKYGTVPVVRATGGLADTVVDTTPQTLAEDTATGFSFHAYTPDALVETVRRALDLYHHEPEKWRQVMRCGMRQDWSWDRSAIEYEKVYAIAKGETR